MRSEIPRMPVNVPPEDREKKLLDALWILQNLRHWTNVWKKNYGVANRDRMKAWEGQADKLLKGVGLKIDNDE